MVARRRISPSRWPSSSAVRSAQRTPRYVYSTPAVPTSSSVYRLVLTLRISRKPPSCSASTSTAHRRRTSTVRRPMCWGSRSSPTTSAWRCARTRRCSSRATIRRLTRASTRRRRRAISCLTSCKMLTSTRASSWQTRSSANTAPLDATAVASVRTSSGY